jgi:dihydrodipicolinate reductase
MSINIAISGAAGRMGKALIEAVAASEAKLVAAIVRPDWSGLMPVNWLVSVKMVWWWQVDLKTLLTGLMC